MSDLLALETQLADTQYNIEQLESTLADTDQQVNDATVRVTLNEEAQPDLRDETVSLGDRIKGALSTGWRAFVSFLQDCVVFLTAALPFIAVPVECWGRDFLCLRHFHPRKRWTFPAFSGILCVIKSSESLRKRRTVHHESRNNCRVYCGRKSGAGH